MRPLRNGRGTFDVVLENVVRPRRPAADLGPGQPGRLERRGVPPPARPPRRPRAGGRVTVYPGQIVALPGPGGRAERELPSTLLHPPGVRRGRARVPRRGVRTRVWRRPSCRRRSGRRARPSGPTSSSSARVASSTSATTPSATHEVIGHLRSWQDPNDRVLKWLRYDPFADEGCRSCIALPTCMGGCAHNQMTDPRRLEVLDVPADPSRQVEEYADAAEAGEATGPRHACCR